MAEYVDKAQVQTELMMNAERYTISHESRGFGIVEWSDNLIPIRKAMEIIRNIPSIEDVPVVRCKDCRYSYDGFKKYVCVRNIIEVSVEPYDYCSMALRKEE